MQQLAARFRDHEEVRHLSEQDNSTNGIEERQASGSYLIRYEGEVYWTELWINELTETPNG